MINKRKLANMLTDGFILHRYGQEVGITTTDFRDKAIAMYRSDNKFHNNVDSLVAHVLNCVDQCEEITNE